MVDWTSSRTHEYETRVYFVYVHVLHFCIYKHICTALLVEAVALAGSSTDLRSRQGPVLCRPVLVKCITRAAFASAAPRAWNTLSRD